MSGFRSVQLRTVSLKPSSLRQRARAEGNVTFGQSVCRHEVSTPLNDIRLGHPTSLFQRSQGLRGPARRHHRGCSASEQRGLTTLSKLPITVLNIDRSLLVNANNDQAARIILRNVVSLCRELGLRSVCEGAENAAHMDILREIGCEAFQGFATGRPGAAAAIGEVFRTSMAETENGLVHRFGLQS